MIYFCKIVLPGREAGRGEGTLEGVRSTKGGRRGSFLRGKFNEGKSWEGRSGGEGGGTELAKG